jgi:hypothetical protein
MIATIAECDMRIINLTDAMKVVGERGHTTGEQFAQKYGLSILNDANQRRRSIYFLESDVIAKAEELKRKQSDMINEQPDSQRIAYLEKHLAHIYCSLGMTVPPELRSEQ